LLPPAGSEVPANGRLTFTWEALPGAAKYVLEIANPNGVKLSYSIPTTQYSLYASSMPGTGRFTWQAAALDAGEKALWTAEPFSVIKLVPKTKEKGGPGGRGWG